MLSSIFNLSYFIVCFSGFIWQVTEICLIYFKYDVNSRVSYSVPTLIHPPGVTLCYRYVELLDYPAMNAIKNKNWINDSFNASTIREIQQTLTIKDILKLTPSTADAIQSCGFRRPGSYHLYEYHSSVDCNKHFKIVKFFILEYICYKYQFDPQDGDSNGRQTDANGRQTDANEPQPFSLQELANSPAAAGQIFRIETPKIFDLILISKYVLHPWGRFPYKEVEYGTVIESNRLLSASKKQGTPILSVGKFSLSYFTLEIMRLPPPFVQNCFNYTNIERQSRTDCHQRCVKDKSEDLFGKVPFSSIETRSIEKSSLSYLDIQDDKIVDELYQMYGMCDKECGRKDCDEYTYFTRVNYRTREEGLEFNVFIPSEPSIVVIAKEILTMTEFVSFILSMFGTWFGISVLTLNPFSFLSKSTSSIKIKGGNNHDVIMDSPSRGHGHGHHQHLSRRDNNFTFSKMSLNLKNVNNSNDDQLQQLIITLTGRVTKVERFVYNYRLDAHNKYADNRYNDPPSPRSLINY